MMIWPMVFPHMKSALTPNHDDMHLHHERRKAEELRKQIDHERRYLYSARR